MSNPRNYTVGWICAIRTEYVAAQAFLDEKHEAPEQVSTNDNNDYTLGRIHRHNVVIAVAPEGEYGTSSAANVARDMMHTFPNVRIGLMVGIGGGVPTRENDIRLGDIVVSTPSKGNGGIFQYDFGKARQGQDFQPTGFLNQPPTLLRTAVAGLRAQYESEGHRLQETIDNILEKRPRMKKGYGRPDPSTDKLYLSDVVHPLNDESDCTQVCPQHPSECVLRDPRAEDEDDPIIHYGLIASANIVIKDAVTRDVAGKQGILCFEMEAAGLMNHFPCLVIRGICDYSDSHKNKRWQGYAAMTAAAYAKDVISRIAPNRVENEKRLVELFSGVQRDIAELSTGLGSLLRGHHNKEQETIINWITPLDHAPQQIDHFTRHQQGTGQWLLDSTEFTTWLKTKKLTLYCPGNPGAGKTILASIVINDLVKRFQNDPTVAVAYLYFNYKRHHDQGLETNLKCLLKQLARKSATTPEGVKLLYKKHTENLTQPSCSEISETLKTVAAMYSRVFIVVDALDECQLEGECRTRFISQILDLQASTGANVLATSRINSDIANRLQGGLSVEIRANKQDVEAYLNEQMKFMQADFLDDEIRDTIVREIINTLDGMFLLAALRMSMLINLPTKGHIKETLQKLSKGMAGLYTTYDQAMERIQGQQESARELAWQALSWIIHARRPLSTKELEHALAVRVNTMKLDEDYLPSINLLQSICLGLVTVDTESGIIRLVHFTAQEYFRDTRDRWFPTAESYIATTCITYLSYDVFENGLCQTKKEFKERLRLNPLYDYAARKWGHHARCASPRPREIVAFLNKRAHVEAANQVREFPAYRFHYDQVKQHPATELHLAAYFGLVEVVSHLLKENVQPDLGDCRSRTPLWMAASEGHEIVIQLLLATGRVEPDSIDRGGVTPLLVATRGGFENVVKLLLSTAKVNPDSKSRYRETPLLVATNRGDEGIIRLLLATARVDVNAENNLGETALARAVAQGNESITRLLLATEGVNPDQMDNFSQSPLSVAARDGDEKIVKLLLDVEKVDPNSKNESRETPLWLAVNGHHEGVVKLLLATGRVDPNSKGPRGKTPLLLAATRGLEACVKLLLATGRAKPDSKTPRGETPLSKAAMLGHEGIVKTLLATGQVDPGSGSRAGETPLSLAAYYGRETVCRLLLATGRAAPDSRDRRGHSPLCRAAVGGHENIVKLLLDTGEVEPDSKDDLGRTPLWWAALGLHRGVMEMLLATGKVQPDPRDSNGYTPQQWAFAMDTRSLGSQFS